MRHVVRQNTAHVGLIAGLGKIKQTESVIDRLCTHAKE